MLYYLSVEKELDVEEVFNRLKSINIAHINFLKIVDSYINIQTSFFGDSYVKEKITTEMNNLGYTTNQFKILSNI